MIKIFADTANLNEMIILHNEGFVKGFTTNPTLMRRAGVTDYERFAKAALAAIPDLPISFEVLSDAPADVIREAKVLSSWGPNVYVKVPIVDLEGKINSHPIAALLKEGVPLNITAIVNPHRALPHIARFLGDTPVIISIFAGRIADTGRYPSLLITPLMVRQWPEKTEFLWASTRQVLSIKEAEDCGCDIITVTPDILRKHHLMWRRNLDDITLDTVLQFHSDAQAAGYTISLNEVPG